MPLDAGSTNFKVPDPENDPLPMKMQISFFDPFDPLDRKSETAIVFPTSKCTRDPIFRVLASGIKKIFRGKKCNRVPHFIVPPQPFLNRDRGRPTTFALGWFSTTLEPQRLKLGGGHRQGPRYVWVKWQGRGCKGASRADRQRM